MKALLCTAALLAIAGCTTTTTTTTSSSRNTSTVSSNPRDAARINLQLGVGYLQEGNLAIAKEKLDRALSQDSRNPEIRGAMAVLDERLGDDKDADKQFREALRLAPNDPSMLNNYAVYLCSRDRAPEGVRYFEQAATNPLYRTPWAAYTNAGVCLRAAKRDSEAAQRFARALQSNPAYAEAVFQASDLDLSLHQYTPARLRIELFLLANPATPEVLWTGWRVAQAQKDSVMQQRYAERLSKEFPASDQARALAANQANPG